jgi:hypothetical protein
VIWGTGKAKAHVGQIDPTVYNRQNQALQVEREHRIA